MDGRRLRHRHRQVLRVRQHQRQRLQRHLDEAVLALRRVLAGDLTQLVRLALTLLVQVVLQILAELLRALQVLRVLLVVHTHVDVAHDQLVLDRVEHKLLRQLQMRVARLALVVDTRRHEVQQLVAHLARPDQTWHLAVRVQDRQQLHRRLLCQHRSHRRRQQLRQILAHLLVARRLVLAHAVAAQTRQRQHRALAVVVGGRLAVRRLVHLHRFVLLQRGVEAEQQRQHRPQHARRRVQLLLLQHRRVCRVRDRLQSVLHQTRRLHQQRVATDVRRQVLQRLDHLATFLQLRREGHRVHQVLAHRDARVVARRVGDDRAAVDQVADNLQTVLDDELLAVVLGARARQVQQRGRHLQLRTLLHCHHLVLLQL